MASKDEQQPPPPHILFFPFLARGHLIPIADMAALFAAHGARCTILTTPVNAAIIRPAVDRANANANNPRVAISISISVVPFPDVGLPPGVENGSALKTPADRDSFFRAIQLLRDPFDRFLSETHPAPDAVVADSHFQWSVDAAAAHGVPRLAFLGTSMFARACTDVMLRTNPMEQHQPPSSSSSSCPDDDDDDPDAMVSLAGLPHRVELRRSQMVDPRKQPGSFAFFKTVNAEDQRSFGEVFNSFHELEPDYVEHYQATLGRRVWLVGPVAPAPAPGAPDADGCLRWLDSKPAGSVVYVSFGTLSSFAPEELRELARGLDISGKSFVWVVTGASDDEQWMPEGFAELMARGERGIIVRGWAPQVAILNHGALGGFVTHCGWNSVLEAVSAGVPMVTWPRFGDQFFNEKLVVEMLGAGLSVGARDYASFIAETHRVIDGEVIAAAIRGVMNDVGDGYAIRRKAMELGVKARAAVEHGGSSYGDVGRLMEELMARRA
ncbi:scopoletin glucosyltransferase [Brachypodium distachyon]|uniref:Glycosyltransferase n=1 Tax=Brachypodium distachyon TaxID=15368 RepID=I1HZ74_BRADI|nr:scopoletin glucosyltransferase [Brachypodium distachyon]KQJ94230.1 hypothetical protein BRADI_3g09330v3 [Brachypodium distachyon]|eukprot:XP_003571999.1 scopoletin glucosyltransferase [Brachypodium distachyon]